MKRGKRGKKIDDFGAIRRFGKNMCGQNYGIFSPS
jgi:hypothetical protein